jgi:hypothetical protein
MAFALGLAAVVVVITALTLIAFGVLAVALNAIDDSSDDEAHGDWPAMPQPFTNEERN